MNGNFEPENKLGIPASVENKAKEIVSQIIKKIVLNQKLSTSDRVREYTETIIKLKECITFFSSELLKKLKGITSTIQPVDWAKNWQEYIDDRYIEKNEKQLDDYLSTFVEYVKRIQIGQITRVSIDIEQQKLKRILTNLQKFNSQLIDIVLDQQQKNLKIRTHTKIRALLQPVLENILKFNREILISMIQKYDFKEDVFSIKHLFLTIKKDFKQLGNAIIQLIASKFSNFTMSIRIQALNEKTLQQLDHKKAESLKNIQSTILEYYDECQQMLKFDSYNNLAKTFSVQLTIVDLKRYAAVLLQIQQFKYEFSFLKQCDIFVKYYKSWWRGKFQSQNKSMFRKHWNLINYFIITIPHGIVQYLDAIQEEKDKNMKFVMEKGEVAFTNFDQGYKHFHTLTLNQKIKFILDLAESLITLQEHGINHNDITIRNSVLVNNRFKFIDFDVARMVDIDFDYSPYSSSQAEKLKQYRAIIINQTKQLMKKELKEQKTITKTDPKKLTTPIQNINRLAEYYNLPNQIQLIKLMKENQSIRNKFTRLQRLNIIFQYEKYIVGKRDCNKFAFMILKLMHTSNQKLYQQFITSRVQEFVREVQKKKNANYTKYLEYFKLDLDNKSQSTQMNEQILKLLAELFAPQLEKRIPMRLFYFKFLEICRIKKYPIVIKPLKPKDSIPKELNINSININLCLEENSDNNSRRDLIDKIQTIFKENVTIAIKHNKQCTQIEQSISSSLANIKQFLSADVSKKKEKNISKLCTILKELNKKYENLQRESFDKIKNKKEDMKCYIHNRKIQAICLQPSCPQKWLCVKCIQILFFNPKLPYDPLSHSKTISVSPIKSVVEYHKIKHFNQNDSHRGDIVCILVSGEQLHLKCRQCLLKVTIFAFFDKIYYVNSEQRTVCDDFLIKQQKKQQQENFAWTKPKKDNSKTYNLLFQNINKGQNLTSKQFQKLESRCIDVTKRIEEWISTLENFNKQILMKINKSQKFQKINNSLQYLISQPNLLKQLKKIQNNQELKSFILKINLREIAKLSQKNLEDTILNICEYNLDKIQEIFENLADKLEKQSQKCHMQRAPYMITHRQIYYNFDLTADLRKALKIDVKVQKIELNFRSIQKQDIKNYKQMKNKKQSTHKITKKLSQDVNQTESEVSKMPQIMAIQQKQSKYKYNICIKCAEAFTNYYQSDQTYQIIKFCTYQVCHLRFICKKCEHEHDSSHKQFFYEFRKIEETAQRASQIDFLQKRSNQFKTQSKTQKILEKLTTQIGIEMIQPIKFILELVRYSNDTTGLNEIIFGRLTQCIINENIKKFNDTLWITYHFFKDAFRFMQVLNYGTERYILQLYNALKAIKQCYNILNQMDNESFFNEDDINKQSMFINKYRVIKNVKSNYTPMHYIDISLRHSARVQELTIENIEQTNKDESDTNASIKQIEVNQLKKKLIRNHFNNFDVHLFWTSFKPYRNHKLDDIQRFVNLRKLVIIDEVNWQSPAVFKSIHIQALLRQARNLESIQLQCLNGFDLYCLEMLKKKHQNCQLELNSHHEIVVEKKWIDQLFSREAKINLPFQLQGEILSPFDSPKIIKGEFCLFFTNSTIRETLEQLNKPGTLDANRLKIVFNHLRVDDQQDDTVNYFQVKPIFWCRASYGTQNTFSTQQAINKRIPQMQLIFTPTSHKFTKIKYLTLHGLLINGGENPIAQQLQSQLKKFLKQLEILQTLQLVKCFGLSLLTLFANVITLKRLNIEQCVFKLQSLDNLPPFVQLQSLILIRVGLFEIASNNKLQSRELASILSYFHLQTLQTLILNEFYELENKELEWIRNCPLKRLSLRRCFKISSDIFYLIKNIKEMEEFDIAQTNIQEASLKQLPIKLCNNLSRIKNADRNSIKVLKELSRFASCYHIKELQKAQNADKYKPLPLNLNEIKEITLENLKIRQKGQYYIFEILAKLPNLQSIRVINCQWKDRNSSLKYNEFSYVQGLEKLQELSLINSNLRNISQTQINQYRYLRKLSLRNNPHLQQISDLDFYQLRELDVSYTGINEIKLKFQKVPNIKLVNIENTNITSFPINLLEAKYLRVIKTSLHYEQNVDSKPKNYREALTIDKIINELQVLGSTTNKSDNFVTYFQQIQDLEQNQKQNKNKQILITKNTNKDRDLLYGNGCICLSEKQINEVAENYQMLFKYELFKIEMDVKGIERREVFPRFCSKYTEKKQQELQQEQIEYELIKIQSMRRKNNFDYSIFNFQNFMKSRTKNSNLNIILFENQFELIALVSSYSQYFVKYKYPVRQYKNNNSSNFITRRPINYVPYTENSKFAKTVLNYFDEFIAFLSGYLQEINRKKIIISNFTIDNIGIDQSQTYKFKVINMISGIIISSKQDSPLYQLLKFIILNKDNKDNYQESLYNFKSLIGQSIYVSSSKSREISNKILDARISQFSFIEQNIKKNTFQTQEKIKNSEASIRQTKSQKILKEQIENITFWLLYYKSIVNSLQIVIILQELRQYIDNRDDSLDHDKKIKMSETISELNQKMWSAIDIQGKIIKETYKEKTIHQKEQTK